MRMLLEQSVAQKRSTAAIVSHGFELMNSTRSRGNPIVVRRFENMCETLSAMREKAPTKRFVDLEPHRLTLAGARVRPVQSRPWRTAYRVVEQVAGAMIYG
jgi:hypothetical protein